VDPRTLFLAQTFTLAIVAALLLLTRRDSDRHNGLRTWSLAITFEAAAGLLIGFPGWLPDTLGATLGAACLAAGATLVFGALRRFAGQSPDPRWLAVAAAVLAVVAALASRQVVVATAFDGLFYGAFALLNAWTLWPAPQTPTGHPLAASARRLQIVIAACCILMGLALPARAFAAFALGADLDQPGLPPPWRDAGDAFAFFCFLVTRPGFVLLCMRRADAEAEMHSLTDDLTRLGNRRALDEALARAVASAGRRGVGFSVAMIDIDQLKAINQALGNRAGDEALRSCAERLRGTIRAADSAFRYLGDTFFVILSDTDANGAQTAVSRWRKRIASPASADMHELSACFGVTTWTDGDDADALVARAERALARAKAAGRDRIQAG
jgi:diguanylate cyclase (GGDEF)-like protein